MFRCETAQTGCIPILARRLRHGKGAMMLSITVQNLGDVTMFRCVGRITLADADLLRIAVRSEQRGRVAVLDLAQVSAIDAAGLGMLVSLWKWSRARGTTFKLMNLAPGIESLLELTNLRSVFEICSVQDMLELLCRAFRQIEVAEGVETIEVLEDIPNRMRPMRVT